MKLSDLLTEHRDELTAAASTLTEVAHSIENAFELGQVDDGENAKTTVAYLLVMAADIQGLPMSETHLVSHIPLK